MVHSGHMCGLNAERPLPAAIGRIDVRQGEVAAGGSGG
jgi:hypothetical protein